MKQAEAHLSHLSQLLVDLSPSQATVNGSAELDCRDELLKFLDKCFLSQHELRHDCYYKLQHLAAAHGHKVRLADELLHIMNPVETRRWNSYLQFVKPKSTAIKQRDELEGIFYYQLQHVRQYHDYLNDYYNRILDSYFNRKVTVSFDSHQGVETPVIPIIESAEVVKKIADYQNNALGINYPSLIALHELPPKQHEAIMKGWHQLVAILEFHFEQHRLAPERADSRYDFQSCLLRQYQALHVLVKGLINTLTPPIKKI